MSSLASIPLALIWPEWTFVTAWGIADSPTFHSAADEGVLDKLLLYGPLVVIVAAAVLAQLAVSFRYRKVAIIVSLCPLIIYTIGFYLLKVRS